MFSINVTPTEPPRFITVDSVDVAAKTANVSINWAIGEARFALAITVALDDDVIALITGASIEVNTMLRNGLTN